MEKICDIKKYLWYNVNDHNKWCWATDNVSASRILNCPASSVDRELFPDTVPPNLIINA